MTGPEHYRAAEQLIEAHGDGVPTMLALAQVHATLALAAATAEHSAAAYYGDTGNVHWARTVRP